MRPTVKAFPTILVLSYLIVFAPVPLIFKVAFALFVVVIFKVTITPVSRAKLVIVAVMADDVPAVTA